MPRFFVDRSSVSQDVKENGTLTLTGEDARHVSLVLRMRPGEKLTVCDGQRTDYDGTVLSAGETVDVRVDRIAQAVTEPPFRAVLYQALVKGDKFDTVVQKAVECGVSEIVPVLTARCTVRYEDASFHHRLIRWRKIAREAAMQCGRGVIPEVRESVSFEEALGEIARTDLGFLCYEEERTLSLPSLLESGSRPSSVAFLIGPEGGIDPSEVHLASEKKIPSVGLGPRILRTETASSFVLACLSYEYELKGTETGKE